MKTKTMSQRYGAAAVAAVLLLLVVATTGSNAEETGILERMVEVADTAASHEAIAAYYEKKATEATASAEQHRALARVYGRPGAKRSPSPAMVKHCEELATGFEKSAEAYAALAAEHHEAAKKAK